MKKILVLLIAVVFVVTLSSCEQSAKNGKSEEIYDEEFMDELDELLTKADDIDNLFGITISVDGEMIREQYYLGMENESNNIYSVTKSISSLLIGIAIDNGFIDSVEQPISDFINLEDYNTEDDLSGIKIRHLLTMSAGLVWDSNNLSGEMINLRSNSDPLTLILGRKLGAAPGTYFNYSDGSAHLVSVVLAEATGMTSNEFANEYLFAPLGIVAPYWNMDQKGVNIGGCDLFLSNISLDLIGNLVLNKGMHNDVRIVSEEWIDISTTNRVSSFSSYGYGYYWWLGNVKGVEYISARGWGGQQIFVLPDLNLVVTSSMDGWVADSKAGTQFDEIESLIIDQVITLFVNNE